MTMGRETVDVRAMFTLSNSEREADEATVQDFRAAVGALLALPRYADISALDEGCTEAFETMDDARRYRVRVTLEMAYQAARKGGA